MGRLVASLPGPRGGGCALCWERTRIGFASLPALHSLPAGTHVEAVALITSSMVQHGTPADRDTCESLSGFHFILAATWASWGRDTCESLSGFYLVLGTTWSRSRDTCESLNGFYFVLGTTWAPLEPRHL